MIDIILGTLIVIVGLSVVIILGTLWIIGLVAILDKITGDE